jgi:hypothetical protein
MSIFTETRTPYEFLVRWNQEGGIQGAHVAWLDAVLKDGEVINQKPTNVESVAIGLQEGYPLDDILSQVTIDLIAEVETLKIEIATLKSEIDALKENPNETETI